MSIFNFIGNICTSDFDCVYMVESPVMNEARRRNGMFTGSVGTTQPSYDSVTAVSESELEDWSGIEDIHIRKVAELLGSFVFLPPTLYYGFRSWRAKKGYPRRTVDAKHVQLSTVTRAREDQTDDMPIMALARQTITSHRGHSEYTRQAEKANSSSSIVRLFLSLDYPALVMAPTSLLRP
jgi:hypothetical protein